MATKPKRSLNSLELRLCMFGAARTLWSYSCACVALHLTSTHAKKAQNNIPSPQSNMPREGLQMASPQPRRESKKSHLRTVQPGLTPTVGFI